MYQENVGNPTLELLNQAGNGSVSQPLDGNPTLDLLNQATVSTGSFVDSADESNELKADVMPTQSFFLDQPAISDVSVQSTPMKDEFMGNSGNPTLDLLYGAKQGEFGGGNEAEHYGGAAIFNIGMNGSVASMEKAVNTPIPVAVAPSQSAQDLSQAYVSAFGPTGSSGEAMAQTSLDQLFPTTTGESQQIEVPEGFNPFDFSR